MGSLNIDVSDALCHFPVGGPGAVMRRNTVEPTFCSPYLVRSGFFFSRIVVGFLCERP